jgi:hypothetical protein
MGSDNRGMIGLIAFVAISLAAHSAKANDFVATQNALAEDTTGSGVFTSVAAPAFGFDLSIRRFNGVLEERTLLEFDPRSIAGQTVSAAQFKFNESGVANSNTRVDILGFMDNGAIDLADATATAVLLGSYDPVALGLGAHSVTLNASSLQSLITASQFVELRLQGIDGTNTQLGKLGGSFLPVPTLSVTVPEPGCAGLLTAAAMLLLRTRRRARG